MVLICGMMILKAIKMIFDRFTNFADEFGRICLHIFIFAVISVRLSELFIVWNSTSS